MSCYTHNSSAYLSTTVFLDLGIDVFIREYTVFSDGCGVVVANVCNVFVQLYTELMEDRDFGSKMSGLIKAATGLKTFGGTSKTSAEGTTHSVRDEEQVAFSNWINR